MPAPEDALAVVNALRLGWYMAEVRGRNRPAGPQPPGGELPNRGEHVLPLRIERTAAELRIEAQTILHKLCGDLDVDTVSVNDQKQSRTAVIEQRAQALAAAAPQTTTAITAWNAGLKTTAQGLLSRIRQDAYTDLVAVAIAEAPDKPGARRPRKVVVEAVRKRTLTTVADARVP